MKTFVVANPNAGACKVERNWKAFARAITSAFGPTDVHFTRGPGDATERVRIALHEGFERVILVGGDGTCNEGLNGFFAAEGGAPINADASMSIFPAGTGGDFPRSIGLRTRDVTEAYKKSSDRCIDVGRATFVDDSGKETRRYFLNISSAGVSGEVVDRVNNSSKRLGGRASFVMGTVRGLLAYRNQRVRLQVDDTIDEEMLINLIAVANGRYFGGAMKIAPTAVLNDGLLDVVALGDVGLSQFARYAGRLYKGTHIGMPHVRQWQGKVVTITPIGPKPVRIDLDGEGPGILPVRYEVVPKALLFFAPWEQAEALGYEGDRQTAVQG